MKVLGAALGSAGAWALLGRPLAALLASVSASVLACLPAAVHSQSLSISSPPGELAKAALGSEPGTAAVGVWRNGEARFGFVRNGGVLEMPSAAAQDQPMFEIGSVSKVFTGLLVAQAVERGELALQDTLGKLLQGKVSFASPDVAAITLQQLLTHSSCLPRQFGRLATGAAVVEQITTAERPALWRALAEQTLTKPPPCAAAYSNYGLAVVGEVLAEKSGLPWETLVREHITGPLGMVDTVVELGAKAHRLVPAFDGAERAQPWGMKAFVGAGGLRSTPHDMLLFGRAVLAGKSGPLGAAAERLVSKLGDYRGREIGYAAFLVGPSEKRSFSHDGLTGGYRSLLTLNQDSGEVMVTFVSNAQAPLHPMAALVAASRYPVRDKAIAIAPAQLKDYEGVFRESAEVAYTIVAQDGQLLVRATRNNFKPYIAVDVDTFTRPLGGAQMTFLRQDGKVKALRLEQVGVRVEAQLSVEAPPTRALLPGSELQGLTGKYQLKRLIGRNLDFDVQIDLNQLAVKSQNFPRAPVFPVEGARDRFYYDSVKAELQFERDASGRATTLVLHQNGVFRMDRLE
jgi:serine-type D-Ala-D-Ala carboxypeptidase/endopeptidase